VSSPALHRYQPPPKYTHVSRNSIPISNKLSLQWSNRN